ncbi:hypothetical protein M3Y98_00050500 [Aphelenchoides besseyi]|nr:hypothetical protein M3Y98_00050500 [Aphelenchoides besseyi]
MGSKNVVLIGNSHGGFAYAGIKYAFRSVYRDLTTIGRDSCYPTDREFQQSHLQPFIKDYCTNFMMRELFLTLREWKKPIDILIVLIGRSKDIAIASEQLTEDPLFRSMQIFYGNLSVFARQMMFIQKQHLKFHDNPLRTVFGRLKYGRALGRIGDPLNYHLAQYPNMRRRLEAVDCGKSCVKLDWTEFWCNKTNDRFCSSIHPTSGLLFYIDEHHTSPIGSFIQGQHMRRIRTVDSAFKQTFSSFLNRNVSRAVTDEEIDLLIRERADRKLLWIYDTFKGEREARMRRYRKRYARWLERMSDEAREIAEAIYRVRNDTSISYSVECKRVNDLKALAPEDVVKELQIRIEDCREFYLVQPQLAKSKCFSGWTQFPIYHGKNYPEEVHRRELLRQRKQKQEEELLAREEESGEEEEQSTDEEDEESEEESDSSEEAAPLLKPVFVQKRDRVTLMDAEEEEKRLEQLKIEEEKRKEERKKGINSSELKF